MQGSTLQNKVRGPNSFQSFYLFVIHLERHPKITLLSKSIISYGSSYGHFHPMGDFSGTTSGHTTHEEN